MPTTLGAGFPTNWRGTPRHMLQQDVPVWWRFLDRYGQYINTVYYSCLVGGPWLTPIEEQDPLKVMWRANTAKRIDALAELEDSIWIIEVSDRPGMRALGQLITYQSLWREDPIIDKPVTLVLVSSSVDEDIAIASARSGVKQFILPD